MTGTQRRLAGQISRRKYVRHLEQLPVLYEGVHNNAKMDDLCKKYYFDGHNNAEICALLAARHNTSISTRHVRRILSNQGLWRRKYTPVHEAITAIQIELRESGQYLGYRALKQRLLLKYGLWVPRDLVSDILKVLDPNGVEMRRSHRLNRRVYMNEGPNFLIHVDGFDKMKKYGFAIHGAIDGFSRRILWLRVANTNNKPEVVASYFVQFVEEIQAVPRCVRMDAGTENGLIEDIQKSFRWNHNDDMAGSKSVIIGPSPANQRIERYWRSCREGGAQFWLDFFNDLESDGHLDSNNPMHVECLKFSFMELVQAELNQCSAEWNLHRIRPTTSAICPSGKPDMMYFSPELFGKYDYRTDVSRADILAVKQLCEEPSLKGCTRAFEDRCMGLMRGAGKEMPSTTDEALHLFVWLRNQL